MKVVLLLGRNDELEQYAKDVLKIDIENDLRYVPHPTVHHTDFPEYIDGIKEENVGFVTTQSLEMIDVLVKSDLDLEVVTVRNCDGELRARKMSKERVKTNRDTFDFDPRN